MRRIMSVGDLKRYYGGRSPRRILFCTDNQAWSNVGNPLKASLVFTSMVMVCNPNVICLKNSESATWFERVKFRDAEIPETNQHPFRLSCSSFSCRSFMPILSLKNIFPL